MKFRVSSILTKYQRCLGGIFSPKSYYFSNLIINYYYKLAALHGTPEQKKQEHESKVKLNCEDIGEFSMVELAPNEHKFKLAVFQPNDPKNFIKFVRKELQLLRSSLPSGIFVKGFEDRMDLYSVMIKGPEKTPYEDGLFFFDFQLPSGTFHPLLNQNFQD